MLLADIGGGKSHQRFPWGRENPKMPPTGLLPLMGLREGGIYSENSLGEAWSKMHTLERRGKTGFRG